MARVSDSFVARGFALVSELLEPAECERIAGLASPASTGVGTRSLLLQSWCAALAHSLRDHPQISQLIPSSHIAVQCTFFEKSAEHNWLVPVHQDLSIPVAERIPASTLSGWSEKEGSTFVHAPVDLLEQLVAVRLHLDPCEINDGPLRVVPGSHRLGILPPQESVRMRDERGEVSCELRQGGALVMRPLMLHSSSKASGVSRRRVLHFVYGPVSLGHGLRWQHAI